MFRPKMQTFKLFSSSAMLQPRVILLYSTQSNKKGPLLINLVAINKLALNFRQPVSHIPSKPSHNHFAMEFKRAFTLLLIKSLALVFAKARTPLKCDEKIP